MTVKSSQFTGAHNLTEASSSITLPTRINVFTASILTANNADGCALMRGVIQRYQWASHVSPTGVGTPNHLDAVQCRRLLTDTGNRRLYGDRQAGHTALTRRQRVARQWTILISWNLVICIAGRCAHRHRHLRRLRSRGRRWSAAFDAGIGHLTRGTTARIAGQRHATSVEASRFACDGNAVVDCW